MVNAKQLRNSERSKAKIESNESSYQSASAADVILASGVMFSSENIPGIGWRFVETLRFSQKITRD
jgi:hypothetical protein